MWRTRRVFGKAEALVMGEIVVGGMGGRSWNKVGLRARLQSLDLILRVMRRSRRI